MDNIYLILLVLAASGAIGGFLAGVMGIGGGIILVPVFYTIFSFYGINPDILMHMAVATSLGVIIPTAISSARAQNKRGAINFEVIKGWGPYLMIGAVAASLYSANLKSDVLALFFAVMAFIMGVKLFLPLDHKVISKTLPGRAFGGILSLFIGAAASLMGIGGATFSVPAMTLFSMPIHKAVGTASLLGLMVAIPGVIGFVISGQGAAGLPDYSLGFVNLLAVAIVAPVSVLVAPLGVATSHKLPKRTLSLVFGGFLIIAATRMAFPVLFS